MRLLMIAAALTAAIGCRQEEDQFGNKRLQDDAVYIRDAAGTCLRMEIGISVSGSQNFQSGRIDVFVVPADQPCRNQSERGR